MDEENGFRTETYYTTGTASPVTYYTTGTASPGTYYTTGTALPRNYITNTIPENFINRMIYPNGDELETIGVINGQRVQISPQGILIMEDENKREFDPVDKEEFEKALKELLEYQG